MKGSFCKKFVCNISGFLLNHGNRLQKSYKHHYGLCNASKFLGTINFLKTSLFHNGTRRTDMGEAESKVYVTSANATGFSVDEDMAEGRQVLSYGDSILYEADVWLLRPRGWINDRIFGFCLEYFRNELVKEIAEDIAFISPEVSQFLKLCQGRSKDEIAEFLEPLELSEKKYVIVPVNDSTLSDEIGGTHWSTMVYSKDERKVFYLDSFHGYNSRHATQVKEKIGIGFKAFKVLEFITVECPQQQNYCDCGLYAICFAEEICKGLKEKRREFYKVNFTPEYVSQTRNRVKSIISELAKK